MELADASDSKSDGSNTVRVRPPPPALKTFTKVGVFFVALFTKRDKCAILFADYFCEEIMEPIEIIAQAVGIVGMTFNILSYQPKTKKNVLILQLIGAAFFTVNFFLLKAITGAVLNIVNVALALVFAFKEKTRAEHPAWAVGFCAAYICSYVLTFTLFGLEPTTANLITEIFPVIGTLLTVLSYKMKDAKAIRKIGLFRSPAWLMYNIFVFSIGGIICEVVTIVSIIIAIIRLDIKKEESET